MKIHEIVKAYVQMISSDTAIQTSKIPMVRRNIIVIDYEKDNTK